MHLLLTGISGLLGRHVADVALRDGHTVTAIVRPGDKRAYDGVKVIERDLTESSSELMDADAVIHCAADTNMSHRRIEDAWSFNIRSTENLAREAKAANVKRFIFVSTANTELSSSLPYIETKIESERMLLQEFHNNNFPVVIVNPSFILGPGDRRSGSIRLIKAFMRNRILVHTGGGKNIVDVRDAAVAIVNAVTMGKPGQRYLLTNESLSYRRIIDLVDGSLNRTSIKVKLPNIVWKFIGYSGTAVSFLRPRGTTVNHITMDFAIRQYHYSSTSARADLCFQPRPVEETIADTIKWLNDIQ